MATIFSQWTALAQDYGVYQYLLPFLVTFIVVYGILEKVQPFGSGQRRVHTVFAAITGLFLLAFAPGGVIGAFFTNFFGAVAVALVVILMVAAVYGLVFGQPSPDSGFAKGIGAVGAVGVIVLFFVWGGAGIVLPRQVPGFDIPLGSLVDILLVLGLLGLLVWAMTGGEEPEEA